MARSTSMMSAENSDRGTPTQQTDDSETRRRNPSRASRHSQQSYSERRNSEYRAASARSLPEDPQPAPILPGIRSPTAIRPRTGMPGTFEPSFRHEVTMEEIRDPEDTTIVGPSNREPGDTFSSPPRVLRPLPSFAIPNRDASPSHSIIMHPAAGIPIRRPVTGYPGVSMVGPGSVVSSRHPSPIRPGPRNGSPSSLFAPTVRTSSSAASMSTERSGPPVPAYPGSPRGPGQQADPAIIQFFTRLLERMETNLRNEIGQQRMGIQGLTDRINHVDTLLGVQTVTIENNTRRIERVELTLRGIEGNTQLIQDNSLQLRREVRELGAEIQGISRELENEREHFHDNRQATREQMETITEMLQGLDARIEERQPREEAIRPPSFEGAHRSIRTPSIHTIRSPSPIQRPLPPQNNIPKSARQKIPDPFEGKRAADAESYLMRLEMHFEDNEEGYQTDDAKIRKLLANTKEGSMAAGWSLPLIRDWQNGRREGVLSSWATLKSNFLTTFGDPNRRSKAVKSINKLSQVGSAQKYATDFRSLAQELAWPETTLLDNFIEGLKPNVKVQLDIARLNRPYGAPPMSFSECVDFAIRADDILFEGHKREDRTKGYPGKAGNLEPTTTVTQTTQKRILQSEIDRRKKEGTCIKCGKTGHRYATCKERFFTDKYTKGGIGGKEGHIEEVEEDSSESGKE